MEQQSPRYLSAAEFQALRYLGDAVRAEYPTAASAHLASTPEAGYTITEIRDGADAVLNDGGDPSFDGFPGVGAALSTAVAAVGTPVTRDERCARCVLAVRLPGGQRTALESWRGGVELALEVDREETGVFLWDARSTANHYETVGAGVLHLPVGTDVDAAAAQLREALARLTRDWSVDMRLAPRDHDGDPGSARVGLSEPWDAQESPDYDLDDGYDGRTEREDT
jgi:hypothetical protein